MKLIFVVVQIIGISFICAANDVPCESIYSDFIWGKTCYMDETTEILSEKVFVSSPVDSSVKIISFSSNKKIIFLPLRVDLKFPNLVYYSADNCAIEKISKRNFMNVKHLEFLWLNNNQIEYIPSDTFEDLIAIVEIHLSENKIKALNGDAFKGLSKLTVVNLKKNQCIDEEFDNSTLSNIVKKVDESCKICKSSIIPIDEQVCKVSGIISRLDSKLDVNLRQASRIATLEAQLAAGKEAKTHLQDQLMELKQIYQKLESSWNSTCTERNKEIARILEMKMIEIDQLLNDSDRKKSDLDNCEGRVNYYKKKSEDLCGN